ncbi:MAG: SDR family oxidoreductase [Oscillatoria sp. PMC 1051.18]|nr:SDR family oxidoreductase [Oscillatoria sp. PMC 1050.18]MEC5031959.1 SDR family oxidoreductase [Oscillatoria sp. PMC 1051.18]
MKFAQQHAIITGGSSGIGKATAILLAKQGANISIIARRSAQLEAAKAEIRAAQMSENQRVITISADVAIQKQAETAMKNAIAQLGSPQLLITSAGIAHPGYFQALPLEIFEQTMAVNYFGTLYCLKAVLPSMIKNSQGHIVLISSGAGLIGIYGYTAYSPSKFALRGLAESLQGELIPYGIKVSIVYPPDTNTPQFIAENETKPVETKAITATAKLWQADDVARVIIQGIERNALIITPGLEMTLLAKFHSLFAPIINLYFDKIISKFACQNR